MGATLDRWNRICLESAHARMHQVGPCPNCVESMASDCDEAKTLNAELAEALVKYGSCSRDCNSRYPRSVHGDPGDMSCSCGYEAAIAKAKGGE